ncbi:MAG: diacylglycerol kinase family protein, partial [Saprospiraceae bacterium]
MKQTNVILVVNPNAGNERSRRKIADLLNALQEEGISVQMIQALDAESACRQITELVGKGTDWLITAGGDGTVHWTVNCIMALSDDIRSQLKYAHYPLGTGNDWGRTYKIPHNAANWTNGFLRGKMSMQDLGWVEWQTLQGTLERRYFANVAGMGFDGLVAKVVATESKGNKHVLVYLQAALKWLFIYKKPYLKIQTEDLQWEGKALTVNIGVCVYSGGAMKIVPHALPDDGLLAMTIVGNYSPYEVVVHIAKLFNGKIGRLKKVVLTQNKSIRVE